MVELTLPRRTRLRALLALALPLVVVAPRAVHARDDLLNDTLNVSPFRLNLRPYATMASNRRNIIGMTMRPGDARMYVATEQGVIFTINEDAAGNGTPAQFFDVGAAVLAATGRSLNGAGVSQRGLQSVAFHPDFNNPAAAGYGKLYTTFLENRPASAVGHNYLGNLAAGAGVAGDGVLTEWTYNFTSGQVPSNTYRELFRVNMPTYDHTIKQAKFNPYARPGDDDYGLLYLTHGDSNVKHSPNDDPLHLTNPLGKMMRINPLQSGAQRYTIPATNPFAGSSDPAVLKEIYSYGHRNPHTYSFNKDDNGQVHIVLAEIGRNNMEEVNLVQNGGNYGWPHYEGIFLHTQQPDDGDLGPLAGYISDTIADPVNDHIPDPLPANEATLGHIFPVAEYDHDASAFGEESSGNAIAGGFVIRNGSDPNLHNQYIFTDFSRRTGGDVFHTDFNQMLGAVDKLDAMDPLRDEASELTQAPVHILQLALDADKNPATPSTLYNDFLALLGNTRTDVRIGEGAYGQMYFSSKLNGQIYLVTNTVAPKGDFNDDGVVDGADFLIWQRDAGQQFSESPADANRDDIVDAADLAIWRANVGKTFSAEPASNAVPEPCAAVLVTVAAAALIGKRGRRTFAAPR